MFDIAGASVASIADAVTCRAAAGTTLTVVVVAALLLGGRVFSAHRHVAAGMRAAGVLAGLTGLARGVLDHDWLMGVDMLTTSWLVAHRSPGLTVAAMVITDLGSPITIAAAALLCAALLSWRARSLIPAAVVIGALAAAWSASTMLKMVVARPRPPLGLHLVPASDPSFPSGHVTGTATLLGIVAVTVGAAASRTLKAWLAALVGVAVLLVAASRLYLGVHWLSDVIAAALLGAAVVITADAVRAALTAGQPPPLAAPPQTRPPLTAHVNQPRRSTP